MTQKMIPHFTLEWEIILLFNRFFQKYIQTNKGFACKLCGHDSYTFVVTGYRKP